MTKQAYFIWVCCWEVLGGSGPYRAHPRWIRPRFWVDYSSHSQARSERVTANLLRRHAARNASPSSWAFHHCKIYLAPSVLGFPCSAPSSLWLQPQNSPSHTIHTFCTTKTALRYLWASVFASWLSYSALEMCRLQFGGSVIISFVVIYSFLQPLQECFRMPCKISSSYRQFVQTLMLTFILSLIFL
jgi:hypothetical protein